jgi:hypothetical protein
VSKLSLRVFGRLGDFTQKGAETLCFLIAGLRFGISREGAMEAKNAKGDWGWLALWLVGFVDLRRNADLDKAVSFSSPDGRFGISRKERGGS